MGLKVQAKFISGSTVRVRALVYDDDDTLVDPTAVTCTIIDADGTTKVNDLAMTALADTDGTYDYFYNTTTSSAKGTWTGTVKTVDGSGDTAKTSMEAFSFKV